MSDFEHMPPRTLGLTMEQVEYAYANRIQVRYWPLRDACCRPHLGFVRRWELRSDGSAPVVLSLSGKAGFVSAKHCELAGGE